MAEKQLPFIDIAVHAGVRDRFAAGQAVVLFDVAMGRVLWTNGEGAALFGNGLIYDLIEDGPDRADVAFRQLAASAARLDVPGARASLVIRMASGFSRIAVQAEIERIRLANGLEAIVLAAPPPQPARGRQALAARMLSGFDDPDTHMAVLDGSGAVLAASADFARTGLTPDQLTALMAAARRSPDRLVKRPILTGLGYLPAALGLLADEPETHLLFCVETALGRMDPPEAQADIPAATLSGAALAASETGVVSADGEDLTELPAFAPGPVREIVTIETESSADAPQQPRPAGDEEDEAAIWDAEVPGADADPVAETVAARADNEEVAEQAAPEDSAAVPDPVASADDEAGPAEDAADHVPVAALDAVDTVAANDTADASPAGDIAPEPQAETIAETPATGEMPAAPADEREADTPVSEIDSELASGPSVDDAELPAVDVSPAPAFRFNPASRPVRFVWKIDTNGVFSEISEEFAATVGPHAADVSGLAFQDLAALFNLDPDGKVAELLGRRDTWSGRTIHWPVEGTDLAVPIDLAALPTYSRTREFDGFRGFGIIRVGDARPDPLAMGLTLATMAPAGLKANGLPEPESEPEADTTDATGTAEPLVALADTGLDVTADAGEPAEAETARDGDEPIELTVDSQFDNLGEAGDDRPDDADFRGERPVLKFSLTPGRRMSDKIIQLEERRARRNDGLTTGEQAAFREIARQLEPFGKRPNELLDKDRTGDGVTGDDETLTHDEAADAHALDIPVPDDEAVPAANADIDPTEDTVAAEPDASADNALTDGTPDTADLDVDDEQPAGDDADAGPDEPAPLAAEVTDTVEADDETLADAPAMPVLPRRAAGGGLSAEIVDQLPVAILIHAGDRLIHANGEFFRLTGYGDLSELADAGGLDALITRADDEDPARQGTVLLVRADDAVIHVSARLQSVRFEDQTALLLAINPVAQSAAVRPAPALAASDDATPVGDGEDVASLRTEVEELRAILETATDGVVLVTAEGEIRSLNRSASALFNYDRDETAGKPFAMLFAHESQKAVMDYLGGLSGHGVASVLNDGREVIGREANGGFIPLFMTMGKLSSGGYCAVIRDITQWKRSEEELRSAKRAAETANAHKSEFLARVSHEIRTPLNAIIGFSDMMSSERFGPIGHQRYVEYANDIGRSGRHVLDIVNDLLDISKIEAGEMDLDFAAVTINDCISEAVSIIQPQANSQRVIIRTSLSQSVPQIVADLRSIKQIALNILANAVRYTPSGGQVVVSTSYETNGSVVLRIRDTGIGMSRSELEQAMKPFRQVTTGSRKRGDGTGLGLPLTKAMVEANRAVFAISSQPNEGTLVEITFPSQRVLAD